MAERARSLMSASEFLAWDDGTDARHELIDGVPVAMAPGGINHAQINGNVFRLIDDAVRTKRPCRALTGAGVRLREDAPGKVYIPDALMTCEPVDDRHLSDEPRLVVEVLSPSTGSHDKRFKLPSYSALPSIEEIWFIDSKVRLVQVWHRVEGSWRDGIPLIGRGSFASHVLGVEVSLDEVYALTSLQAGLPEHGPQDTGGDHPHGHDAEHGQP